MNRALKVVPASLLTIFVLSTLAITSERASLSLGTLAAAGTNSPNPCLTEFLGDGGSLINENSPYSSTDNPLCTIQGRSAAAQQNSLYMAGGFMSYVDHPSSPAAVWHSYAFLSSQSVASADRNDVTAPAVLSGQAPQYVVHQGAVNWSINRTNFQLDNATDASTGQSCLAPSGPGAGAANASSSLQVMNGQTLDLSACPGLVAVDLGNMPATSSSQMIAALEVNNLATIKAYINGQTKTCSVPIGRLLDYKTRTLAKNANGGAEVKIVQPSGTYDPCYMHEVQDSPYKSMPLAAARAAFYKDNPTASCISWPRGAPGPFVDTPVTDLKKLSPFQDVSYTFKDPTHLAQSIRAGRSAGRDDCAKIAAQLFSDPSGIGSPGSSGKTTH